MFFRPALVKGGSIALPRTSAADRAPGFTNCGRGHHDWARLPQGFWRRNDGTLPPRPERWASRRSGVSFGFCRIFGGILVLLGLFTRYAALAILINMLVAIWKVHWNNGLLGANGYQFPLCLAAMCFTLICYGAGPLSLEFLRRMRSPAPEEVPELTTLDDEREGPSSGPLPPNKPPA